MLYRYDDIRVLQLEATAFCNAACPMCIRFDEHDRPLDTLKYHALRLDEYKRLLDPLFLARLTKVSFCGNYGDPMMMVGLPELLNHIRALNGHCALDIETNGGMLQDTFWRDLPSALKKPHTVVFNIDGLADTLHIYRRNVHFARVIQHAKEFIANGGNAVWAFLVFKHNEHQVEDARAMAKDLGFSSFQVRLTDRFYRNDGSKLNVFKKGDALLYPPTNPEYVYTRIPEQPSEYKNFINTCAVDCMAKRDRRVYIDYAGNVFPCCYTAAVNGSISDMDDLGTTLIAEKMATLSDLSYNNIRHNTLRDIVEGELFQWIARSFDTPARRPVACSAVCGARNLKVMK